MSHPAPPARSPHPAPDGPPHTHQALVTGIGITAPNGLGAPAYWDALLSGRSGLGPITRFDASGYPVRIAGEITDFADEEHIPSRLLPSTDRSTRLALAAAQEALDDAGAGPQETAGNQAGVMTASLAGGAEFGQRGLAALWSKGATHVSAYQSFASFHAAAPAQISIRHRLRGHGSAIITEQAGGIDALARARRRIRDGAPLMVTGGVDSTLCPWGWAAHLADGRLSPSGEPHHAYRPFAATADGHTVGEGGALLVLEDARSAARRGATGYGTVAGCASTFDGPRRPRLREAAELALAQAGLTPAHVDVVFADGAGRRSADRTESTALCALFGPYGVPVTVPKTMTGRLGAGGAALDVATALLALNAKTVPPTTGTTRVAGDCPLDLVTAPRRLPHLQVALVLARGRGGFNAATVLRAPHPG
ncbi:Putative chain length factor [Streptomyces ambofaciens ATCC 23877]|uniref:Putative chain length factor n=2 Tax=Streptomyces ambofaciens TaxID=1889 RepID=Q1RQQ9_STRA7|nr:ketosynthase chain-length factor [Streptomyces ambofaciens]AAR30161.1 putative chain length determinant [Streptomyces ambofaciens ATCC 23877]AKZ53256.1 Putative chain length factor [Streptomyces ambofaciens ATCC 23877]AKZ60507.1 Putative chain length factor [Streptomyces ambofaciens ATCC 23877]CAI78106.1 putative chain length factor protein [Streptomyces ambofaciens ATCC 23877]CAI78380.1 putative chain length factor protein [Streptomyces ambofaciens ATCC 23877]